MKTITSTILAAILALTFATSPAFAATSTHASTKTLSPQEQEIKQLTLQLKEKKAALKESKKAVLKEAAMKNLEKAKARAAKFN